MTIVIAFVANLFTQFVKGVVYKKWGVTGVYITVFVVALLGTVLYQYVYSIPEWHIVILKAIASFAAAITLYEVILKRIGFADAETKEAQLEA